MPLSRRVLLVLALLIAGSVPALAQPGIRETVEELVTPYAELAMFDGVILLARGDTVVHHAAYGRSSVELDAPLVRSSRFRIASISKAFTAIAIGTLVDQGLLTLDTTLDAFAPSVPEANRITIGQLVTHRSGIVHINALAAYDQIMKSHIELDSLVRWIADQPLDFEPGTSSNYSNGGYALLAHVIERAAGQPYGDYLETSILRPLGLMDTEHEQLDQIVDRLARGYQPGTRAGVHAPATYVAPDIKIGGGSIVSSAPDLLRFVRSLDRDDVVSSALADSLLGTSPVRYLSGRAPGYNAVVMRNRPQDLTAIVLSNSYAVTANSLAPALLGLLSGTPAPANALTPSASTIDWSGSYDWPSSYDNDFEIRRAGEGWLYDEGPHGDQTAAVPLADGTLLLPLYDTRCARPEGGDLICTAPWTSQSLVLSRR
ncbi:MAG: serine hydrolase domain-containing protein [Bacteroidota bacterium]